MKPNLWSLRTPRRVRVLHRSQSLHPERAPPLASRRARHHHHSRSEEPRRARPRQLSRASRPLSPTPDQNGSRGEGRKRCQPRATSDRTRICVPARTHQSPRSSRDAPTLTGEAPRPARGDWSSPSSPPAPKRSLGDTPPLLEALPLPAAEPDPPAALPMRSDSDDADTSGSSSWRRRTVQN